jgi:NTP pyrophosphatase (non-canonical NTP hydrolase)
VIALLSFPPAILYTDGELIPILHGPDRPKQRDTGVLQKKRLGEVPYLKDLSVGITTESSELMEIFRFKKEHEQEKVLNENREAVEDELADVLFFTLRFADLYDIDLQEALDKKLEKNRHRYPKEEYKGSNKKYDE